MNKQELIDKAVHEFGGEWPSVFNRPEKRSPKNGFYVTPSGTMTHKDHCEWFKESEFQQRARELGYINGYRWGVEYPTNGKKPDLDGDVFVACYYDDEWDIARVLSIDWSINGLAHVVTKFKITDPRYKPSDTSYLDAPTVKESLTDEWYDYDNQKAIALPPVGVECEFLYRFGSFEKWPRGQIRYVGVDLFVEYDGNEEKAHFMENASFRPLDHNRKAEAEKKRVVDAAYDEAITAGCVDFGQWLGHLYDKGYLKLPTE